MALHGRRARLLLEYEKLINLEKRSEFIKIEPVDTVEGMPPENYLITFKCRGVSGLNEDKSPQFAEFHQVSMKLSNNFPNQEPYLKWLTPIWHPNIEHKEPHHVCTNNVQNWYSTKSLDDLVLTLGEMVQYRRYHAAWIAPFPLDKEAADWVVNFAEPNGFIGPEKPVDERQILRPQKTRLRGGASPVASPPKITGRLKLGVKRSTEERFLPEPTISTERPVTQEKEVFAEQKPLAASANAVGNSLAETVEPVRRRGIMIGVRTKEVMCIRCYDNFTIPNIMPVTDMEFVCEKCRAFVKFPG
ncbi:hypothetical protein BH10ACI1_BH10ACI1_04110 [soil metagenome]